MPQHRLQFRFVFVLPLLSFLFATTHLCGADAPAPVSLPQLDIAPLPTPDIALPDQNQAEAAQALGPEKERAERLEKYFRPSQTDIAALSPDGKYLAYSLRAGSMVCLVIAAADEPAKRLSTDAVLSDEEATPTSRNIVQIDPVLAKISWMAWFPPARLVFYANRFYLKGNSSATGLLGAVNAADSKFAALVVPMNIELTLDDPKRPEPPHSFTMGGFCPDDPQAVLLLVRGGGNAAYLHNLLKVDVATGKIKIAAEEWPKGRRPPLYLTDRQGRVRITVQPYDQQFDDKPRPYRYTAPGKRADWKDLNEVAGKDNATFTVPAGGPNAPDTPRSIPIGFDENNPNVLCYASNIPTGKYGIYGLNLATGKRTALAIDDPDADMVRPATTTTEFIPDNILIFDRFKHTLAGVRVLDPRRPTRWFQADLRITQTKLEDTIPDNLITILGWSQDRTRYIARASGPADPGGFYLYDSKQKKMSEFAACCPWLDETMLRKRTELTYLDDKREAHTLAYTMPPVESLRPGGYRVVVLCRPDPDPATFRADAQALAAMGYVALEAGTDGPNILLALDALAKRIRIDPRRVAILGEKAYAVTALKIFQDNPARFRCAIAIEAVLDDTAEVDVKQIKRPVYLINDPAELAPSGSRKPYFYSAANPHISTKRACAGLKNYASIWCATN